MLADVEKIVFDYPDSALMKLQNMDASSIEDKESLALYDLLYTHALYNNYHPISNDSLLLKALSFYKKKDDLRHWAWTHYYYGCNLLKNDSLGKAMQEFLFLLEPAHKLKDDKLLGRVYEHIGYVFFNDNNFNRAECFFMKAKGVASKINDSLMLGETIGKIGCCHLYREKDDAKSLLLKAKEILQGKKYTDSIIAFFDDALCVAYMREGNPDSALYCAKQSLSLTCNSSRVHSAYVQLGIAYCNVGQIDSAFIYLEKATGSSNHKIQRNAYMCLSDVEYALGNSDKALEYERLYSSLQDSVVDKSQKDFILAAEKEYAIDKEKTRRESQRRKFLIQTFLIVVLSVFAILVLYFTVRKLRKNSVHLYKELETTSMILNQKDNYLRDALLEAEAKNKEIRSLEEELNMIKNDEAQRISLKEEVEKLNAQRLAIISEIAAHSTIYQKLSRIIAQGHAKGVAIERMEESDWIELVSVTSQLYPDLILTLRRDYGLKEADIRFCSLVLADYNLNELSFVLFRTQSAIHKRAKYILHTKLGFTDALPSSLRDALLSIKPTPSLNQ